MLPYLNYFGFCFASLSPLFHTNKVRSSSIQKGVLSVQIRDVGGKRYMQVHAKLLLITICLRDFRFWNGAAFGGHFRSQVRHCRRKEAGCGWREGMCE
jgi:hypothetical protein